VVPRQQKQAATAAAEDPVSGKSGKTVNMDEVYIPTEDFEATPEEIDEKNKEVDNKNKPIVDKILTDKYINTKNIMLGHDDFAVLNVNLEKEGYKPISFGTRSGGELLLSNAKKMIQRHIRNGKTKFL
jgi:hypothetical protein